MALPRCGPVKHLNPAKATRYGNALAMHALMHARTLMKIVLYAHVRGTSEVPRGQKP